MVALDGLSLANNPGMCGQGTNAPVNPTTYYPPCDGPSPPIPGINPDYPAKLSPPPAAPAPPAPKPKHIALVMKVNRALPPLLLLPLLPLLLAPLLPLLLPLLPPTPAALHTVGCRRGPAAACFSAAPCCNRGLGSAVRPLPKLLLSCSEVLASCSAGSLRGC